MIEINRYWQSRGRRYHLLARFWWRNPLPGIWRWLCGRGYFDDRIEVGSNRWNSSAECYCPTGSETVAWLTFFGIGFRAWLSRDWTKKPCVCDKVMWLVFPDLHADEIEEYGLEKLQSEFPGVGPSTDYLNKVAGMKS